MTSVFQMVVAAVRGVIWRMRRALGKRRVVKVRVTLAHIHGHLLDLHEAVMQVLDNQCQLDKKVTAIMATQSQLAQDLQAVSAQLTKIGTETTSLLQKITELEAAVAAGGQTTPEVDAALQTLKDQAKVVDDLVQDAAP